MRSSERLIIVHDMFPAWTKYPILGGLALLSAKPPNLKLPKSSQGIGHSRWRSGGPYGP